MNRRYPFASTGPFAGIATRSLWERVHPRRSRHSHHILSVVAPNAPNPPHRPAHHRTAQTLPRHHRARRFSLRHRQFYPGRPPGWPCQLGSCAHAGQLALADAGKHPHRPVRAHLQPRNTAAIAALCDTDDPPGIAVLRTAVLLHHHHLEQRPVGVHRPAWCRRADFDHRSAVLQVAGTEALAVPGATYPDPVRRPADRAADHPAPDHRAKLQAGPDRSHGPVVSQPCQQLPDQQLAPCRGPGAGHPVGWRRGLASALLGATSNLVDDRSGGQYRSAEPPAGRFAARNCRQPHP